MLRLHKMISMVEMENKEKCELFEFIVKIVLYNMHKQNTKQFPFFRNILNFIISLLIGDYYTFSSFDFILSRPP